MGDVGNICNNIKWEMQPNFERYFDNDFQNKVAGWISFDTDPIPLLQIEGCASSTCKYTHINIIGYDGWPKRGNSQNVHYLTTGYIKLRKWYLHAILYSHLEEQRKLTCTERGTHSIL